MPARVKRKTKKRPLPPGQKLLLFLFLAGICCYLTISFLAPLLKNDRHNAAAQEIKQSAQTPELPFRLEQPLTELQVLLVQRCNQPKLKAGVFMVEPASGKYLELDGKRAYPAASMIKLPVLVRLLQAIDSGKVKFDQNLVIRKDLIGGGSGWLQWRKPGTKISLKDTAELMMVISDNTATNMIIDLLGGKESFNETFRKWGLTQTQINNWLPDLDGTNTTSPYDLSLLLGNVHAGKILKPESRTWLLTTLERNHIKTLLPKGVPSSAKVADKTGDIGKLVGDAGIITTKDGQCYIVTVAVERPHNDRRANALIRRISKDIYIGVTGDVAGAKTVIVDDEQKPSGKTKRHRHHRRHQNRHHR